MGFMGLVLVSIELFLQIFVDFLMVNSSVKKPIPWGGDLKVQPYVFFLVAPHHFPAFLLLVFQSVSV